MPLLTNAKLKDAAKDLDQWEIKGDKLYRQFIFKNFNHAFSFMTQVAMHAEKYNHHPEWSNVYKTVEVHLTTHSDNGITEKDIKLAKFMDAIATL